jgi:hypothetical protein
MKPESSTSRIDSCAHCGCEVANDPSKLDIAIKKGDVRRASKVADGVFSAARGHFGVEQGVVFMTTILLIERLAAARNCDPRTILRKVAGCFQLKEQFQHQGKHFS